MAQSFTFTSLMTLTDGNQFRLKDDPTGFILLAVKIGASPIQEVKLTTDEADRLRMVLNMAIMAKKQDVV